LLYVIGLVAIVDGVIIEFILNVSLGLPIAVIMALIFFLVGDHYSRIAQKIQKTLNGRTP
jgi:ABC-type Mn2+/Zn2+ transport system permease subunit